jgi:hypothetical protein
MLGVREHRIQTPWRRFEKNVLKNLLGYRQKAIKNKICCAIGKTGERKKIMNDEIKFKATYKNKTYAFAYGSKAYIFHAGVYNGMDSKYGIKTLLQYVSLVHNCYLSDDNRTPLGAFADFVAEKWEKAKGLGKYELLDGFYQTNY